MTEQIALNWANVSTKPAPDETQILVNRCLAGDETAYVALYNQCSGMIYRLAYGLLQNKEDAEEVLQECNMVIWKKIDQFRPGSDFMAWAYRIAYFQVLDYKKRFAKRAVTFSPELLEELVETQIDIKDELDERRERLNDCMAKLSEVDRELLKACYAPGAKMQEVAERLGRKLTSIYRSLRRIRKLLQDCVSVSHG